MPARFSAGVGALELLVFGKRFVAGYRAPRADRTPNGAAATELTRPGTDLAHGVPNERRRERFVTYPALEPSERFGSRPLERLTMALRVGGTLRRTLAKVQTAKLIRLDCAPGAWLDVLLVEFPGYGRSSGTPSQETITGAVLAAHEWTQTRGMINSQKIVAYGRSLGGGAAAILAARRPTAALLLESTFTSVRSFAHDFWLPEFVVLDSFDTLAVLVAYDGPVLVLHGNHDEVVPVHHAEELARAARNSELELASCGHNDCPPPWAKVRRFLVARGIIAN